MKSRVVSTSTVMALALLGDSLLYVVLPLHGPALGLSAFQVGVLLSANRFVRMLTNTGASRLMRRLAPGPFFTAATILASFTTLCYTLLPVFPSFLLARFAWGLSFSALRLGCFITVLGAATDGTRGRLMGTYQSISRAGSFVAVMAGGALFDAFGYRAAVLAMATGTALAVPLALVRGPANVAVGRSVTLAKPDTRPEAGRADAPRPRPATGWQWSRRLAPRRRGRTASRLLAVKWSAFALSFVARGVVTATLSLFLSRDFGEGFGPGGVIGVATLASWLIGVRWASEIGLAAPLGALSDRLGRARAATGWLIAAAAAVLALATAPAVGVALAASIALFVAASGLGATLDAAAGDLASPHRRAEVMSSYADWADLGAALGPLMALTFADSLGLRPTYLLGGVLLVSGAAGVVTTFREALTRPSRLASANPIEAVDEPRATPMSGDS
jgi:MFS family permease